MSGKRCSKTAYFLVLFIFILAGQLWGQEWKEIEDWEWELGPPMDYPEASAVKIFDIGEIEISVFDGIILERHVRLKVFDKDRAENVLMVEIPKFEGERVYDVDAHTITPDGERHKVKDKFKKEAANTEILTFTFPAVQDGSILEYRYRYSHSRYWMLDPWYFQSDVYTLRSRYIMRLKGGFGYNIACANMPYDKQKPIVEDAGNIVRDYKIYTWELTDLMPLKEEPKTSALLNSYSALYMQLNSAMGIELAAEWSEIGEGYQELFDEFADDLDDLKEKTESICADAEGDIARIKAVYDFVRDSIRTKAISEIVTDTKAKDLLEEGEADSADKNTLLAALLSSLDFDAHVLLIGTRDHIKFNPSLMHLLQLNHVLCHVSHDSTTYILDGSYPSVPFPYLPPQDLIYGGVLIDGEDTRAISFEPPWRPSSKTINSRVYINEDGSAICSTTVNLQGHCNFVFDDYIEDSLTGKNIVETILDNLEMDYELLDDSVWHDIDGDSLLAYYVLEIPEYSSFLGDNMLVPVDLASVEENPFKSETRSLPVDFNYPYESKCDMEIYIPASMKVTDLPAHVDKTTEDLSFRRRAGYDGSKVTINAQLVLRRAYFQSSEYKDIKWVFDAMEESCYDQIALAKRETDDLTEAE